MENIKTVFIDMPTTIKAYTILKDDFYTIVINAKISSDMQRMAFYHELYHIKNKDLESDMPVGMIEIFAHKIEKEKKI